MIEAAAAALREGKSLLLPTDTVYGLCAAPYREDPVRRLSRLKGRDEARPLALLAVDVDFLLECVPELRGRSAAIARALLPGPYTLVLPNPARRYRWLTGTRPDTIGVRVADLPGPAGRVLERAGALIATSANRTGEAEPRTLAAVPAEIRRACAVEVDGGELPGIPSTVLDFTGEEVRVLREGAGSSVKALARLEGGGLSEATK